MAARRGYSAVVDCKHGFLQIARALQVSECSRRASRSSALLTTAIRNALLVASGLQVHR